ncbi:DUF3253 domain-containing protein [Blastochloris viridis]|uniref:DUF3253 domain-containing protein n=1 Tax=Blastochloris viridis TaxID=1079 RepID=A0A0H5BQG7_BLAVI|nr:DUF3253 domain-containing protein [Blastochloris viridis]ALK09215.1 hypothetical protein BVIR_1431 [Blastochloris viridis]BAS00919.1 hypothetical protein BV133_3325 [Blastochloris viridis]CUU41878.1 hypothetical protein BVIRIDIS_08760 [Blastochloris viridis]
MTDIDEDAVARTILSLATARAGGTICPTDAARAASGTPDWHPLLPVVRRVAVRLALEGRLVITRKGKPVDPTDFKGVYRLGLPRND